MKTKLLSGIVASAFIAGLAAAPAWAADEDAAKETAKRNDCFKCHAIDKTKKGPPYKKIASKWKGKPDADAKLFEAVTKLHKVKLEDGTEEDHKVIDTKDPKEIKNLLDWIRSQ